MRPHGEIASVLVSMSSHRQVEGAKYGDGLEEASDNGMLVVNSPNDDRLEN